LSEYVHGILAYGSLLVDPGEEIAEVAVRRIPTRTPFPVEYARSSKARAGAPTLVPVKAGIGAPVQAQILVIGTDLSDQEVQNRLYRREVGPGAERDAIYDDMAQRRKRNAVLIEVLHDVAGIPTVFYTSLKVNIPEVVRADVSAECKANLLAGRAIASVTAETYSRNRDGIRYLADALDHGVRTPLTEAYRVAVLRRTGDAPDLETALQRLALKRGFVSENGL
jgi:hypothetical protein